MNKTSIFKSEQGRIAIMDWYDAQIQKLPVQMESKTEKSIATAKQILPNLRVAKILKGQGHIFDKHATEQVFAEIKEFLKKPR